MNDRTNPLERVLEATARKMGGGLHPLELLQRLQATAEASVRDGVVANDYLFSFHPADYERYSPVMRRLAGECEDLLAAIEERNGWRHVGDWRVEFESSPDAAEAVPAIAARFAELRKQSRPVPAGATRRIVRHKNLRLQLSDGSIIPVTHTPFTIGRASGNDLVLPILSVSRQHAEIVREPEGIIIRDLGSRNGLVVEGERVEEYDLAHGGAVTLGDISLQLEHE